MEKFSILYVDDEESNLRVFKDTFRRNYNVYIAISAKEGIRILESEQIDLILSDQRMPEMTGVEFLKYTFEKFPKTNRILVTGFSDIDAVENAINKARVFQYVQKPWDEDKLLSTIEDALRIHHLEKENARQKEELIEAKRKAEENDRLKTEFLNNLSHEIRTPLNGVYGFSNLLSIKGISKEDLNNYISIIQFSSQQLVNVVDHILAYTKLITKKVEPEFSKFSLNQLLSKLYNAFKLNNKDRKGLDFIFREKNHETDRIVFSSKVQLYSILSNILDNAFKFTEAGLIELGYETKDDKVEIFIKDTGVGINPKSQEEIFNQFSREEKGNTAAHGGLGIGLSIARESAVLIGANIGLQSEKGKGTTFYVSIPINSFEELKTEPTDIQEYTPSDGATEIRILVVEDENINYMLLEHYLKDTLGKGILITHVLNGKEAVEECQRNSNYNIILMDVNMPIMDGHEATTKIKELFPNIPVLMQTAYSTNEDKEKAFNAGCDGFITKPINHQALKNEIKKYIEN